MPVTSRRSITIALLAVSCALVTLSAGQAHAAPPKPKDFVGKADQKRNPAGIYTFESGAYKIATDIDKPLANDVAAHMDAVYREYATRLSNFRPNPYAAVKPNEKMPLYVLRRYNDYVDLLAGMGVNGANTGGVFFRTEQRQSGLATWVEGQSRLKMYYVLQHEGFHQFADARIMSSLPPWVNEGLAEYFADAMMVDGRLLIGRLDRERIDRVRDAVGEGKTLPFSRLMTMDGEAWRNRVNSGDSSSALMYDTAWSVCYFLIHGGKGAKPLKTKEGPALENYLLLLNQNYIRNPRVDPSPQAFQKIFSNNLAEFERQWKRGLEALQPDPWLSSVRHLQFVAVALRGFHEHKVAVESWPQLKEYMTKVGFRTRIRERDAGTNPNAGAKPDDDEDADKPNYDFPANADVQFTPSTDPKLPPAVRIAGVSPNILLSWSIGAGGELEEIITFRDLPKTPAPVANKPTKPK